MQAYKSYQNINLACKKQCQNRTKDNQDKIFQIRKEDSTHLDDDLLFYSKKIKVSQNTTIMYYNTDRDKAIKAENAAALKNSTDLDNPAVAALRTRGRQLKKVSPY